MTMTENERAAIEEALKRPLDEAELIVVRDIDELQPSHLDVMKTLHSRNGIAALFYLRAVTDDIDPSQLRRYVHGFDEVIGVQIPNCMGHAALFAASCDRVGVGVAAS